MTFTRRFILLALALVSAFGVAQSTQTGTGGAAATVDRYATEAAIAVLELGGNAVDAAVTAAAVLNVTNPFSVGIGGGGFMVVYLADEDRVVTLDMREMAPGAATPDMFIDSATGESINFFPDRISSGLAVGIPGTLLGWEVALERYGTIDLATALAPAIDIAENGFPITETFSEQVAQNLERFSVFPATAALYLTADGAAPEAGSIHKNPDLAQTFRTIAEQGSDALYHGAIGEDLVATVQNPQTVDNPPFTVRGQTMTMADLDAYEVRVRRPTVSEYRGYEVYGMGAPSSGGLTVSLILNMLDSYDLSAMPEEEAIHTMLEASRLAYADRGAYMADSDFVNVPVEGLLSQDFADTRAPLITDTAGSDPAPGDPFMFQDDPSPPLTPPSADTEGTSTTHLTVADAEGNVVSFTTTIESTGGSGIVVPGRGFLLNNELTDFDSAPGGPNVVEAYKRPRSSMSPTIVMKDGRVVMALGSPGGSTIITTVLQTILNVTDFGMDLPEAVAAPRLSQRNSSATSIEAEVSPELLEALMKRGHEFRDPSEIGAATGIFFNPDGTMTAVAEPVRRSSGTAQVVTPQ
ncbi:gamma-glutamyltransferase [soil metagenome]